MFIVGIIISVVLSAVIGENYDNDAPSLIHLDGVVKNPTITIFYADGSLHDILKDGNLQDC